MNEYQQCAHATIKKNFFFCPFLVFILFGVEKVKKEVEEEEEKIKIKYFEI